MPAALRFYIGAVTGVRRESTEDVRGRRVEVAAGVEYRTLARVERAGPRSDRAPVEIACAQHELRRRGGRELRRDHPGFAQCGGTTVATGVAREVPAAVGPGHGLEAAHEPPALEPHRRVDRASERNL